VRRIRDPLARAGLGDVHVGTVDKFQGQEAPVVFFSMATSSGEDVPRNLEFLFSRNRLNVAISRAQCLAYVVCNPRLLEARATTIEQMARSALQRAERRWPYKIGPTVAGTDQKNEIWPLFTTDKNGVGVGQADVGHLVRPEAQCPRPPTEPPW
jgi:hypothetical protein